MRSPSILKAAVVACLLASWCAAESYHVAVDGRPENDGTMASPWDIASTWAGGHSVAPGSTILLKGGTYRHPDRSWASPGFAITLAGREGAPIVIRPIPGDHVRIDGGVVVKPDAHHIHLRDIEITVSETARWDRRVTTGGHEIVGVADLPRGGLNILGGSGSKFINLVIHDMDSGVGFWRGSVDAGIHGCLIYNIGSIGPDRYHGPGIYTQNETGTKQLTDNILFGNYSTTIQAYGSSRAFVNGFRIVGNIAFAPVKAGNRQRILVGGGRPSRDITVRDNILYETPLQVGYTAPHNENAVVAGNRVINAGMSVNRFKQVEQIDNFVLAPQTTRPDRPAEVILRPDRHTPGRAHLAILNWRKAPAVAIELGAVVKTGHAFEVLNALDYFGKPVASGVFEGSPVSIPVPVEERTGHGEFCAFVVQSRASTPPAAGEPAIEGVRQGRH